MALPGGLFFYDGNMNERNFLFFINPISGTGKNLKLPEFIESVLKPKGYNFQFVNTNPEGDYSFLKEKINSEKITDIVICGGDGTISTIGSFLEGNPVRVGIIPSGSGNGLALSAGIPKNKKKAVEIILKGKASWIDGFRVNHHFSCMLSGLGFDAKVAHDFAHDPTRGLKTYIKLTISNWLTLKSYPFTVFADGRVFHSNSYFISIANANQFGNHIRIAPGADLSDGKLDVVIVNKTNRLGMPVSLLMQILSGSPSPIDKASKSKSSVRYFQASVLKIKNEKEAPLHIDGEPVETQKELDIRIIRMAINLMQPNAST